MPVHGGGGLPLAEKTVEELKSIRKYFGGDFYNHGSAEFDESSWAVWQYHDPESQSGIVMAFRRPNKKPDPRNLTRVRNFSVQGRT